MPNTHTHISLRLGVSLCALLVTLGRAPLAAQDAPNCMRLSFGLTPQPLTRSLEQQSRALTAASQIIPRGPDGTPDAINGYSIFVTIGPSYANQLTEGIVKAFNARTDRHPRLKIVNGTSGGQMAEQWTNPLDDSWRTTLSRLHRTNCAVAKVSMPCTEAQVGAVFMAVTNATQDIHDGEDPQVVADEYHANIEMILSVVDATFPNARVVYVSQGYYLGCAMDRENTEPYGFYQDARLQRIQDEYQGRLALLGLSMWADGNRPRYDGLTTLPEDLQVDGRHLNSVAGKGKFKHGTHIVNMWWADAITQGWLRR